jgi:hypothetical protein
MKSEHVAQHLPLSLPPSLPRSPSLLFDFSHSQQKISKQTLGYIRYIVIVGMMMGKETDAKGCGDG